MRRRYGLIWIKPRTITDGNGVGRPHRLRRDTGLMKASRCVCFALLTLAASLAFAAPSHAITGAVRVTLAKAGFIVGGGGGRGVLTFRHRNYPFTVQGLSLGLTAGASVNKLVGRAEHINEISD